MCKADIFNEIIQIVSRETEIAPKVILSGSKEAEVVDARYLLVYFLLSPVPTALHCKVRWHRVSLPNFW